MLISNNMNLGKSVLRLGTKKNLLILQLPATDVYVLKNAPIL